MTTTRRPSEAVEAAAYYANRCRFLLRDRVNEDAPVSVETLVHEDGSFSAIAFHTVWRSDSGDNFAREAVSYSSTESEPRSLDNFVHAVRHYHTGHHERFYEYYLDQITE